MKIYVKSTRRRAFFKTVVFVFLAICFLLILPLQRSNEENTLSASAATGDSIRIEKYDVEMTINENREVDVREKITVTFLKNNLTMFYRSLPIETARYENISASCEGNDAFSFYVKDNPDISGFFDINCVGNAQKGRTWTYEIRYTMQNGRGKKCRKCKRPSCIHPKVCPNLNTDHRPLLDIYHAVDALPGIKKSFIGSGVRYDLLLHESKDPAINRAAREYTRELIAKHVSGRLKVAPEHTSDSVLHIMRKPPFAQFYDFKKIFDKINNELNLRQQIIPYFISSHPGCTQEDMAELAVITKRLDFHLEQVQDFTPTPMTVLPEKETYKNQAIDVPFNAD